jgi:hypothetical protein
MTLAIILLVMPANEEDTRGLFLAVDAKDAALPVLFTFLPGDAFGDEDAADFFFDPPPTAALFLENIGLDAFLSVVLFLSSDA